jgi:anti-anti-sigma factor
MQMADQAADFSLDLAFHMADPGVTVAVSGDLDLLTAPALAGVVHGLLNDDRRRIVIDLARCRFVDVRGMAVFAEVAQRAGGLGGTVTIRSASQITRRVLYLTGVSELVMMLDAEQTQASPSRVSDSVGEPATQVPSSDTTPVPDPQSLRKSATDAVDAALRLVTALAQATLTNADGVSVTLERHGRLMTVAASNDKVLTMDRHQYETGEGPCLEARAQDRWFYIESLAAETRWPTFTPLALGEGIHSILSSPLKTRGRAQGALNIYSATTQAFGQREQELAALFAEQASEILTTARHDPNNANE